MRNCRYITVIIHRESIIEVLIRTTDVQASLSLYCLHSTLDMHHITLTPKENHEPKKKDMQSSNHIKIVCTVKNM